MQLKKFAHKHRFWVQKFQRDGLKLHIYVIKFQRGCLKLHICVIKFQRGCLKLHIYVIKFQNVQKCAKMCQRVPLNLLSIFTKVGFS